MLFCNKFVVVGVVVMVVVVFFVLFILILLLVDFDVINIKDCFICFFFEGYFLGIDYLGWDLFLWLMWGIWLLFVVGFVVVFIVVMIGLVIGIIVGYFGGCIDNVIMCGVDMLMVFFYILFVLVIVVVFGLGLFNVFIVVVVVNVLFFVCNICGIIVGIVYKEFVDVVRLLGMGYMCIILSEVLLNVVLVIVVVMLIMIGWMILEIVGLLFFGFGL